MKSHPPLPPPPASTNSAPTHAQPQSSIADALNNHFQLPALHSSPLTELHAGFVSFLSVAYLLVLNAHLLPFTQSAAFSTALVSGISTIILGLFTNAPFILSPAIGLTVYYSLGLGSSLSSDSAALKHQLATCALVGIILMGLGIVRGFSTIRQFIPASIKSATMVGLGLLISLIGLTQMRLIHSDAAATDANANNIAEGGIAMELGSLRSSEVWLGIVCLLTITALFVHRVRGAALIGIVVTSLLAMIVNNRWPVLSDLFVSPVVPTAFPAFDFAGYSFVSSLPVLLAFLFIMITDSAGVLYAFHHMLNGNDDPHTGGVLRHQDDRCMVVMGASTLLCAFVGIPPLLVSVEGAVAIHAGGRSGLTAVVSGLCYLLFIPLLPLLQLVPPAATGGVLLFIGAMLACECVRIPWQRIDEAIPAFMTIIIIPFTFSVANGILFGCAAYALLFVLSGRFQSFWRDLYYGRSYVEGSIFDYEEIPASAREGMSGDESDMKHNQSMK